LNVIQRGPQIKLLNLVCTSATGLLFAGELIEYCIHFLEAESRHCSLAITMDDVLRFCHVRNVAEPTQAERLSKY